MESTEEFEKLLFLYKTEGKNMSIETFCVHNGINYRAFDKWYRNTHKNIVPVQIVDIPEEAMQDETVPEPNEQHVEPEDQEHHPEVLISLSLYCNNGVSVKRRHLTFGQLKELIVKLEGLC
ncbi:hypothetical protein [Segatella bryantii]|uniref:hypothetical protein n=1 Tax=Segatella bryantii TaxID=77095 RepID=UPI00241DD446|nr:hypothetical protein [Segatella bryantii]